MVARQIQLLALLTLCWCARSSAQDAGLAPSAAPTLSDTIHPSYTIGEVLIKGNRKTRNYIVERELSFKKGDAITLSLLVRAFRDAHDRLINTHLFNEVIIYV